MDSQDASLFAEIARHGSFAAVARHRGVDPSSISRALAGLEIDLGVRLFQRTTRSLSLTEQGELYLSRVLPLLEELERLGEEVRASRAAPRGTLRLSASVAFGQRVIVPRLREFRDRYPSIEVEGLFTDANVDLIGERIDLAIRLGPAVGGDLVVSRLMGTCYRVVASPSYLANAPPLKRPRDLSQHRAVLFHLSTYRTRWLFRKGGGNVIEQPVAGDLVLSPAGAIRDAVLEGHGPALLPNWLIDDDIASGRLVHLLSGWRVTATSFDTAVWAIYPSRAFLPVKTRVMIDFLREALR